MKVREPDDVAVSVREGVIVGVGRGKQPAYCGALHNPSCSTPLTQQSQQMDAVALPVQVEQSKDCATALLREASARAAAKRRIAGLRRAIGGCKGRSVSGVRE